MVKDCVGGIRDPDWLDLPPINSLGMGVHSLANLPSNSTIKKKAAIIIMAVEVKNVFRAERACVCFQMMLLEVGCRLLFPTVGHINLHKTVIRVSKFTQVLFFRNRHSCSTCCVVIMKHVDSTWSTSSRLSCWTRAARPSELFSIIAVMETATSSMLPSLSASPLVTKRPKRRKVRSHLRH